MNKRKKTILIVDDAEINRKILTVILEDRYHILEAENGIAAKRILEESDEDIALILLDIVMPMMDGFAFLKSIQKKRYASIPVIFVTAETYEENVLSGVRMGVKDVIAKPFNPDMVIKRVDHLISLSEHLEEEQDCADVSIEGPEPRMALIVDDVGINRAIIRNSLEEDYDIEEAGNGEEALEIVKTRQNEIAVVLLDIIMPVMDGYAFMREANHLHLLKGIPVIAITAEESMPKLNRLMELGICEIVQKPFTPSVVKNRVDYIIKLARARK